MVIARMTPAQSDRGWRNVFLDIATMSKAFGSSNRAKCIMCIYGGSEKVVRRDYGAGAACSILPGFSTGAAGSEDIALRFCTIRYVCQYDVWQIPNLHLPTSSSARRRL